MKKLLIQGVCALFLLTSTSVNGQNNTDKRIPGEILIQVTSSANEAEIKSALHSTGYSNGELISKHMRIWKFQFDPASMTIDQAIANIYHNSWVVMAQGNHKLEYRATTPNDPSFAQQWQYVQSNDKDIDADLAWDITTGGVTALGDTIVVAVIDDGIKLDHPDWGDNLWVNRHETDGNGQDDDGNGYVDDYKGWNAYNNDDEVGHVNWEGHGSAVAGIVGAQGNNGIGVTGVNWDVKIMVVKGGGQESDAIAAYSYVLETRKLYNSTNGTKGAFVVATNASWGVDFGQASQAPLWCAMYDTLGHHGILSVGAGPNANTNVDTQGDLPTQCPSDYLIAVTNTDQTDTKVTQAGYGVNSIDLGAPGEGAYNIADNNSNGYAGFGGTSGATPHVAGTIGLLYSAPCNDFATLARSNPRQATENVRDYILNGVDPNSSLNGVTTTNGRLNVFNSLQSLMQTCSNTGLEENNSSMELKIYPNPINGETVRVKINSINNESGKIMIYDLKGKMVYSQDIFVQSGINTFKLDLSGYENGAYLVKVLSENNVLTSKLIKN